MNSLRVVFVIILVAIGLNSCTEPQSYYFSKKVSMPYEEALVSLKAAIVANGFGLVSEQNTHEVLMSKVPGSHMDPYITLGICNAKEALAILERDANMGLFLPCKAIVKYIDENNSEVIISNPEVVLPIAKNNEVKIKAKEISKMMEKILEDM